MTAFNLRRVLEEQAMPILTGIEQSVPTDRAGESGDRQADQLSYAEVQRLLSVQRSMRLLSPDAEVAMLRQLLEQDATDLRLLRRLRDVRKELGQQMEPSQEELALRADLLLDPNNLEAAHTLARLLQTQAKPISLLIEEGSLREDLRRVPGDPKCSVRLGDVLEPSANWFRPRSRRPL
jgi:hypothetical protein